MKCGPCESELINAGILWPYTALVVTNSVTCTLSELANGWGLHMLQSKAVFRPTWVFECKTQPVGVLPQPQMYTDTYVVAWLYVWSGDLLAIGPMCAPPIPQYMWGYTLHRLSDYRSLYPPSEFSFTLHCRYDVDFVLFSGSFPSWENVAAALQLALWHDWVY